MNIVIKKKKCDYIVTQFLECDVVPYCFVARLVKLLKVI